MIALFSCHAITLVQAGATIEGQYTDVGGTHTAFTVSIGADGKLTVVQNVALEHLIDGGPADYNDALGLAGKIGVTATVTDADGDTAVSGVIDVGGAVTFLDDGPSISSAVVGSSVTLDETANGPTTDGVLNPAIMSDVVNTCPIDLLIPTCRRRSGLDLSFK